MMTIRIMRIITLRMQWKKGNYWYAVRTHVPHGQRYGCFDMW